MTESVKASRRAEQARATRRRIIEGARELFLQQGYAATTLEQIAARAGVAVQTVYFHFGNKRTLLKEVMDVLAVSDDAPVPAAAGMLLVGASLAPVVPTALSVAGRSVPPQRAGAAVSVVATAGYAAFVEVGQVFRHN